MLSQHNVEMKRARIGQFAIGTASSQVTFYQESVRLTIKDFSLTFPNYPKKLQESEDIAKIEEEAEGISLDAEYIVMHGGRELAHNVSTRFRESDKAVGTSVPVDLCEGKIYLHGSLVLTNITKPNSDQTFDQDEIRVEVFVENRNGRTVYKTTAEVFDWDKDSNSSNHQYKLPLLGSMWKEQDLYFQDDTLRIRLEFSFFVGLSDQYERLPKVLKKLSNDMLGLLNSGEGTNITIYCGSAKFLVHDGILSARSPVFAAMLSCGLEETKSGIITVDDVEPQIFKRLLEYIYASKIELDGMDFEVLSKLAQAADKYQLIELKNFCFHHLLKDIQDDTFGSLAVLAYLHSAEKHIRKTIYHYLGANYLKLAGLPDYKTMNKQCPDAFYDPS